MKLTAGDAVLVAPSGGSAEKVRLIFSYYRLPFQDTIVPTSAPSLQLTTSPAVSKTLTQPWAMVRVVARLGTGSLFPLRLEAEIEEWLGVIQELEKRWYPCLLAEQKPELLGYREAPLKEIRETFVRDELPQLLAVFEQQLALSGPFLLRQCTVADLCLQPLLVEIVTTEFVGEPLAAFPSLKKFMALVAAEVEPDDDFGGASPLAKTANSRESASSPGDQDRDDGDAPGLFGRFGRRNQRANTD
jgi:glutathione S-transferase